jgi:signal recognition particle GTPase
VGDWNYDDLLTQLRAMRDSGPSEEVSAKVPALGVVLKIRREELDLFIRVLEVMTPTELRIPELVEGARGAERRKRIASDCGATEEDVERFTQTFLKLLEEVARVGKKGGP